MTNYLSINHEIKTAFTKNPTVDVRGVFLDLSKVFGKVWHIGIIFKLKANGVEHEIRLPLKNYLEIRKQRVVLNSQTSEWRKIMSGVPQVSVLEPLLFLIYIYNLPDGINSLGKVFADDKSLFSKVYVTNKSVNELSADLEKLLGLSVENRQLKLFSPDNQSQMTYNIHISNLAIRTFLNAPNQKHLGIVLDSKLKFNAHVDQKMKKGNRIIGPIRQLSISLPRSALTYIN